MRLASAREDAECLARKVTLLEDDLVTEHRAREGSERDPENTLRTSPSYRLGAPSYVTPSSVLLG
jgi:hypothetical protein